MRPAGETVLSRPAAPPRSCSPGMDPLRDGRAGEIRQPARDEVPRLLIRPAMHRHDVRGRKAGEVGADGAAALRRERREARLDLPCHLASLPNAVRGFTRSRLQLAARVVERLLVAGPFPPERPERLPDGGPVQIGVRALDRLLTLE